MCGPGGSCDLRGSIPEKLTAAEMMQMCITCGLFEHCFRKEVPWGKVKINKNLIFDHMAKLAKELGVALRFIPEFAMNMTFMVEWVLDGKEKTWQCHHDVPHETPPYRVDTGVWSPGLSKDLSRLVKAGLVERTYTTEKIDEEESDETEEEGN